MELSPPTSSLLADLEGFSGHRLTRASDLGILLELAHQSGRPERLDDMSFLAKFVSRVYRIIRRIGPEGTGYDRLAAEFSDRLQELRELLRNELRAAPADIAERMTGLYLAPTPDAMENLLALSGDLSWYKNWQLDHS